ncbi:class I SAM-dependent methyltransferase [Catellatospora paridis]|uniref:class I SAM-dependent methyltransferase n=1 Tax=Catellatospora paridis TaxID=1617086 RepID=UPI0012D383E8|nr:class I SAM-dependent methyltransferase [Catellatospora paridis]
MTGSGSPSPRPTSAQQRRWDELLTLLADSVATAGTVVVDGYCHSDWFADRLHATLHSTGRHAIRLTRRSPLHDEDRWYAHRGPATLALADGAGWRARPPGGRWDVVIWLRTPAAHGHGGAYPDDAQIVVDLHDPDWPIVRHIDPALAAHDRWYLPETRAFFAVRAATWDIKFGDDMPTYAAAVAAANIPVGTAVADIGCGTGRALPALRAAVGPEGTVIGVDVTTEMLTAARDLGRSVGAHLVLADARHLPLADGTLNAVFAAGLLHHLPDTRAGLAELARVTGAGGRLVLFHPSGRAALAARHGRTLAPDEPMAEGPLRQSTAVTGWRLDSYEGLPNPTRVQSGSAPMPSKAGIAGNCAVYCRLA